MFNDNSGELIIKSTNICDDYSCTIQKNCDDLGVNWNDTNEVS